MIEIEKLLEQAVFILQQDGELNVEGGLTPSLIYQDDRIEMIGQLSQETTTGFVTVMAPLAGAWVVLPAQRDSAPPLPLLTVTD